jgi:hypothetical protein
MNDQLAIEKKNFFLKSKMQEIHYKLKYTPRASKFFFIRNVLSWSKDQPNYYKKNTNQNKINKNVYVFGENKNKADFFLSLFFLPYSLYAKRKRKWQKLVMLVHYFDFISLRKRSFVFLFLNKKNNRSIWLETFTIKKSRDSLFKSIEFVNKIWAYSIFCSQEIFSRSNFVVFFCFKKYIWNTEIFRLISCEITWRFFFYFKWGLNLYRYFLIFYFEKNC